MARQGIGTSLAIDAFRAMISQGATTVNISTTTEEGRLFVESLVRGGYLSEPFKVSESGKSEHRLLVKEG